MQLFFNGQLADTDTTIHENTKKHFVNASLFVCNTDGSSTTFSLYLSSTSASTTSKALYYEQTLEASKTLVFDNIIIPPGYFLIGKATTASIVNVTMNGVV